MDTLQLDLRFRPTGDQSEAIRQMIEGLEAGLSHQTLLGVTGSGETFSIANVIAQVQRPTLVLAPNKTPAAQFYGELKTFSPHDSVEYFASYYDCYQLEAYVPSSDTYVEKDSSINDHIEQMCLSVTKALFEHPDAIIVATVPSIYGLGDSASYLKAVLHLDRSDRIDQRELLWRPTSLQHTRSSTDLARTTFCARGDVIDIFPAKSDLEAIRVELLDDEVGSFLAFDPLTGEVIRKLSRFTFCPKSHYVTPRETLLEAIDQIKTELKKRLDHLHSSNKLVEVQRLEQRMRFSLGMILGLDYCSDVRNYSRYLSERTPGKPPPTPYDYLPANSLLVIGESHVSAPRVGTMFKGDRSRRETLVGYGFHLPSALDSRPLHFGEWEAVNPQTIFVSAISDPCEAEHTGWIIGQVVRPTGLADPGTKVRPAMTQVDDLLSQIRQRVAKNERVLVTTLTKRMAEDLTDYLGDHDVRVRYLHSDADTVERVEIIRDLHTDAFDVLMGINLLREGLNMPEVSLMTIPGADKEGFLRSKRSLIQIIGRAARNLHGRAILYADSVIGSMQYATDETERRRARQIASNQVHGIVSKRVRKDIEDILEGAVVPGAHSRRKSVARIVEESGRYKNELHLPSKISRCICQLEEGVYQLARDLEFEAAAQPRDEVQTLRERLVSI